MKFTKMHGAGNDYVYVNCFEQVELGEVSELAKAMSIVGWDSSQQAFQAGSRPSLLSSGLQIQ